MRRDFLEVMLAGRAGAFDTGKVVLVLLRHGQSVWNLENRFTGWWDSDLTSAGEEEARASGRLLRQSGLEFSCCWTSVQTRAVRTLWLALEQMGRVWLPVVRDYRLNERHYGGLTGLDKVETALRHGEEQVREWRRSYAVRPPPGISGSSYDVSGDLRYRGIEVPAGESLQDTLDRVEVFWRERLLPGLGLGENMLISAHGNSLRALVKLLFEVSDEEIAGVEIPTGSPLVVCLGEDLRPILASYLDRGRGIAPSLP